MEWDTAYRAGVSDKLAVPNKDDKVRSFSTSTPFIHGLEWGKSTRSLSASIISTTSNDSGLGDSMSELTISRIADADLPCGTTTIDVIQTPTFSVQPEWHGRQLDLSGSLVLRKTHFLSRRSVDCDSSFISDNDTTFNISEVNLNKSSIDTRACKVRKLNLDLDVDEGVHEDSVSVCVDGRVSDTSCMVGGLALLSNVTISEPHRIDIDELSEILDRFSPDVMDRLIGRRMGRERVDVLGELAAVDTSLVATIISYVDPSDMCSMCLVNKTWKSLCVGDSRANARRRRYLKQRKKSLIGKENLGKRVSGRTARQVTVGPSSVLQSLATVQAVGDHPLSLPHSPSKNTKDLFAEAVKDLKNDETLRHCPKCRKPAKVFPVQDRGKCCNAECHYDYCIRCLYEYHGSRACVPLATKRTKLDAVGTKKSKKNLKRL